MTITRGRAVAPLLLLAFAIALAPGALAEPSEDEWSDERRDVHAWPDGGGFVLRSTRDSAVASDELAADYDARAAHLAVTLHAVDPAETTLAFVLAVHAVTEFTDTDGDGLLSMGEPISRRIEVPGTPVTSVVEAIPGGGWRATSTHTLPSPPPNLSSAAPAPGRFEVVLEARPEADGGSAPTRLDLDLRVLDGWARNGTHLAVETTLDVASTPEDVSADVARVRDEQHALATTWQDGQGTVLEGNDERSMKFVRAQPAGHIVSFPAALSASWDPASTDGLSVTGGQPLLYIGAAVVAAAAFLVPAWRRLRSQ